MQPHYDLVFFQEETIELPPPHLERLICSWLVGLVMDILEGSFPFYIAALQRPSVMTKGASECGDGYWCNFISLCIQYYFINSSPVTLSFPTCKHGFVHRLSAVKWEKSFAVVSDIIWTVVM